MEDLDYKPHLEIISIDEHEDGSATIVFDVDKQTLRHFAGIGLLKVIKDSADTILNEVVEVE